MTTTPYRLALLDARALLTRARLALDAGHVATIARQVIRVIRLVDQELADLAAGPPPPKRREPPA